MNFLDSPLLVSWLLYSSSGIFLSEDPPSTGSDVEKQLLEAARSGDMEVVKVNGDSIILYNYVNHQLSAYVNLKTITDEHCCQKHV